MWNHLFKHVDINKNNVHILDGNASNLDEECRKFEAEIAKLGGIELFLGGKIQGELACWDQEHRFGMITLEVHRHWP